MKLVSFGCSLISGTELSDFENPRQVWPQSSLTWPCLLAKKFDLAHVPRAKGGSGNLCILDRVLQNACVLRDAIFVIGWTYADRFDYSHQNGMHFNGRLDDYLTLRPAETNDLDKFYFRELHSEYKDKLTNLIYIKTAIDFLTNLEVPFLMTCVDNSLFDEKWHAGPHIKELQKQIRPSLRDFEGQSFIEWSRQRKYAVSDQGHPLEQAHAAAAEQMAPAIDAILRRA